MNNSTPTPKKITLEDIAQRKQEVLQEICDQKQAMADTTRRIFAPLAPAASGGNALMRSFSTGMAIFDGQFLSSGRKQNSFSCTQSHFVAFIICHQARAFYTNKDYE